ncbi:hypothetical protein [Nannocystis radixulma]|uniref:Uncharacterized protein n=1 Tax=Nannocystis radixulma TaxID=2995305 RepID=A0ABT5BMM8_9BACT|nr:hypothetical protein [Nannocystis radixulma]MDC0674211.1 hypothetical protein [Nannocystis radixulma]
MRARRESVHSPHGLHRPDGRIVDRRVRLDLGGVMRRLLERAREFVVVTAAAAALLGLGRW